MTDHRLVDAKTAAGDDLVDDDLDALRVSLRGAAGAQMLGFPEDTSTVYNGTTALTPKFAAVAVATIGNNTVVAAVASKKIRVLSGYLIASGTVNAKWQSGASGTDLTGLAYLVANAGFVLPFNAKGWFETASGVLLNINLSANVAVGGAITYVEV